MPNFFLFIFGFFFLVCTQSKYYSYNLNIPIFRRQNGWYFLDRMHLEPGKLKVDLSLQLIAREYKTGQDYELEVAAISDSSWAIETSRKCDISKLTEQQQKLKQIHQIVFSAGLNKENSYTFKFNSVIDVDTHQTYHFVLRDCKKSLIQSGYGFRDAIQIRLNVLNNDNFHSSTQSLYVWLLPFLILAGGAMLFVLIKQQEENQNNGIKTMLKISLWLGVASIIFKYIGFVIYYYVNGTEYNLFDVMYLLFHSSSDSIMMILLVLLAFGWTIQKPSKEINLYFVLAGLLGIVNVILTLLNKITDGQHNKYHMFDSIIANIMLGFRIFNFVVFICRALHCLLHLRQTHPRFKNYYFQLIVIGTLYLSFLPIGFILIQFVQLKNRKEWMYFWIELIRFALCIWLTVLARWSKSPYRLIIGESFMQKAEKHY